ncbi:MAG: hypothetical protein S4CHLAM20_14550 [Chlamydiia bacterium]|nr:hypothetical protein [Chlamydiia bacterium]
MVKKCLLTVFITALLLVSGCSTWKASRIVKIGIDPTFFASAVGNKQGLVYAYVVEFFEEVFKETKTDFEFVELSFDNTLENLDNKDIDLLVTSLKPNIETDMLYDFSKMFLSLGDVFVTRSEMPSFNFKDFDGKIIALQRHPNIAFLFAKYPAIALTYYTTIPEVLVEITNFKVDGALIPYLSLASALSTEYRYFLKIDTSKKYTEEGLRLISLKGKNATEIRAFNKKLSSTSKLQNKLLMKWDLVL